MKYFLMVLFISGLARAQVSSTSSLGQDGLTILSSLFYVDGDLKIAGFNKSDYPTFFYCGKPNSLISLSGESEADIFQKFVRDNPKCFEPNLSNGKAVVVQSENSFSIPAKGLISCNCTTAQIDSYFKAQACRDKDKFIDLEALKKACDQK